MNVMNVKNCLIIKNIFTGMINQCKKKKNRTRVVLAWQKVVSSISFL